MIWFQSNRSIRWVVRPIVRQPQTALTPSPKAPFCQCGLSQRLFPITRGQTALSAGCWVKTAWYWTWAR